MGRVHRMPNPRLIPMLVALLLGIPLCGAMAQHPVVRIHFVPETPSDSAAAAEYARIWAANAARVVAALERTSSLRFVTSEWADTAITARVLEAPSYSGWQETPMRLRSSYPADTKLAALVHELGHRLQPDLTLRNEDPHGPMFLWLYDVWVELEGKEWADGQVAIERGRAARYVTAWDAALSLTAAERAAKWRALVAGRSGRAAAADAL